MKTTFASTLDFRGERAEELANVLDRFEREAADLVFEAEEDRDKRIARAENRMKQLSDFYR